MSVDSTLSEIYVDENNLCHEVEIDVRGNDGRPQSCVEKSNRKEEGILYVVKMTGDGDTVDHAYHKEDIPPCNAEGNDEETCYATSSVKLGDENLDDSWNSKMIEDEQIQVFSEGGSQSSSCSFDWMQWRLEMANPEFIDELTYTVEVGNPL